VPPLLELLLVAPIPPLLELLPPPLLLPLPPPLPPPLLEPDDDPPPESSPVVSVVPVEPPHAASAMPRDRTINLFILFIEETSKALTRFADAFCPSAIRRLHRKSRHAIYFQPTTRTLLERPARVHGDGAVTHRIPGSAHLEKRPRAAIASGISVVIGKICLELMFALAARRSSVNLAPELKPRMQEQSPPLTGSPHAEPLPE
jgi:hypothetical protein